MSALDIRKKFIAAVKNRPMLYINIKNEQTKLWKEIAAELNLKEEECRKQWKSLKTKYQNYLINPTERKDIHFFQEDMEFLLPHIVGGTTPYSPGPSGMADNDLKDSPEANSALPLEQSTSACEGKANVTPEEANKPGNSASTTNPKESEARYTKERTSNDSSLGGGITEATKSMTLQDNPKDEDQLILKLGKLDPDLKVAFQEERKQLFEKYLSLQQKSAGGTQHSQNTTN